VGLDLRPSIETESDVSKSLVKLTFQDSVATLTLNRPPLNVLNIEMMDQINSSLLELRGHTELKVLVIRGEGKAFCAGVDVADHTRDKVTRMIQVFHRIFETLRLLDVIAIAAVDGHALGGGFELAIGCPRSSWASSPRWLVSCCPVRRRAARRWSGS
jgi:enoyl-CoA hydratase/carnithine racemase